MRNGQRQLRELVALQRQVWGTEYYAEHYRTHVEPRIRRRHAVIGGFFRYTLVLVVCTAVSALTFVSAHESSKVPPVAIELVSKNGRGRQSTTTTVAPTTTTVAPTTTTVAPTTTTIAPTTTTIATTTTTAPALACSGVSVAPGANVQNVLNAYGTGTTFCFQAGTYVLTQPVTPKSFDTLISVVPRGAVFSGNSIYNAGLRGYGGSTGQHDVTVSGFVFKGFANVSGSIQVAGVQTGDNWTVTNNEIANNANSGISLNAGNTLRGNWIHHNGRLGVQGTNVNGTLLEGNEISFNNAAHLTGTTVGGALIIYSSNVTFRGNNVHDNYGDGLHSDGDYPGITYENNTVTNNWGVGILHEVSVDAVIRNNTLSGNDLEIAGKSIYYGADLFVNDSKNVEIYGNVITAGVHGIGLYDSDRGSGPYGLYEIRNDNIHDNAVTLPRGGASGLVGPRSTAYTSANNVFVHNTYYVADVTAGSWQWNGTKTWTQWRSSGNDTTGTLYTWAG